MNSVRGSVGTDAALSRLRSLIPMLLSHLLKRLSALTEGLHGQWPVCSDSFPTCRLTFPALRSRLQTSLKWRVGLPTVRVPVASSPWSISLRILPSSMRLAWPSHRSLLWQSKANALGTPACARTSLFGTRSCQVMPIGSLSSNVFEGRSATGSERFSFSYILTPPNLYYKCLYSCRDDLPKKLQNSHCRLTCVAQKRRCLNSLISFWGSAGGRSWVCALGWSWGSRSRCRNVLST